MKKDDVEKGPSTLYLERDLKFLAKSENVNLSALVNDLLRTYFAVGSKEEIYKEIEKHRDSLGVLEKKLKKFDDEGVQETRSGAMWDAAWDRANQVFKVRLDSVTGEVEAFQRVKQPKACEPLLRSGLNVQQVLDRLLEVYHGV